MSWFIAGSSFCSRFVKFSASRFVNGPIDDSFSSELEAFELFKKASLLSALAALLSSQSEWQSKSDIKFMFSLSPSRQVNHLQGNNNLLEAISTGSCGVIRMLSTGIYRL